MAESERHNRARDRRTKRQQRDTLMRRTGQMRQIAPADEPRRSLKLPRVNLRRAQTGLLAIGAIVIMGAVIALLGFLNPPTPTEIPNAIWLDARWTYGTHTAEEYASLTRTMRANGIGSIFAYVSSMLEDETWAGAAGSSFNQTEEQVISFVTGLREAYPDATLYAWIEVQASTGEGYRLDSPQVQRVVADLSQRAVQTMGFDGVFLDIKPVFDANPDFPVTLQAVRRNIGLETLLAVAIPADLTPTDAGINLPPLIAPNTVWSPAYKQRIALQADKLVVTAYNSYLTDPVDYINWVSYQVKTYVKAMSDLDTTSRLLIALPSYDERAPAHLTSVETIPAALDGINRALLELTEAERLFLQGVAIFADRDLTDDEWRVYRERWMQG